MQRFTISLDDALARQFDELIAAKGYENRSEAVRDLIRSRLGDASLAAPPHAAFTPVDPWCVATVSYVYDHHDQTVARRVLDLQHEHHDLVVSSLHTHLDHDDCLETAVLRGPLAAVQACAERLVALRGVRHGAMHLVPLAAADHGHTHAHGLARHSHLKPLS
ncbi:nickel-responsive transcriptional regulator NikR [Pseudorhodoferax sp. Leaf274]|uniref:nickel-responsive transcriptional regulator NikR n=1 Tax=Pseudorhodoferax sp. Leaf274 TaxID=1736318 RepID=UPI000702AA28|nr:nickel-responsive transcriptional regulator NikR [Pseudorhodoferax sp. Leaf274]KQP35700.1 nickel responsive regulator [Pseudorhodoferax sp. Leaf274]